MELSKFTESISFAVNCNTQQEVDEYWEKLSAEGGQKIQCGWLKDKCGLSWQITPIVLYEMLYDPNPKKSQQVFEVNIINQVVCIYLLMRCYNC